MSSSRSTTHTCKCGSQFTRLDALKRHAASSCAAASPVKVPCPYCDRYQYSYLRRDHLLQHLKRFHKFSDKAIEWHKSRGSQNQPAQENLTVAALGTSFPPPLPLDGQSDEFSQWFGGENL